MMNHEINNEASAASDELAVAAARRALVNLTRSSISSLLLIMLGAAVLLGAVYYSATRLRPLEMEVEQKKAQIAGLQSEVVGLEAKKQRYADELTKQQARLVGAREAVTAGAAGVKAYYEHRYEDAVAQYDKALEYDPDDAYLLNVRAYSLFKLHRLDDAIQGERRSVAADPKYAWGYFDLARFLCAAGSQQQFEEAAQAASRAIALSPGMESIMRADGEFQRECRHKLPS